MEAAIIFQVHLKAQLFGAALFHADHWPDGLEVVWDIAQIDFSEAELLKYLPCHLGLKHLHKLHLNLINHPVFDQGLVSELPVEKDCIQEVAHLIAGGGI